MGKQLRVVSLHPVLVDVAGSMAGGVFLSNLYFWFSRDDKGHSRLRIHRQGKPWVAKSAEEWWDECRLTRRNLRTIEPQLESLGLVEIQLWKFDGAPTKHYHLDLKALDNQIDQFDLVVTARTITTGTTTEQKAQSTSYSAFTDAFASEGQVQKKNSKKEKGSQAGKGMGEEESMKNSKGKNSKEVFEELQLKKNAAPTAGDKVGAKMLSAYWQKKLPLVVDIEFQRPHTLKELGVLARYIKTTGQHAVPALDWALTNWDRLRARAKEADVQLPSQPSLYGLLKGCQFAVNGYLRDAEPEAPFVKPVMPVVQMNSQPGDEPATKEQIEAMLKDMGAQ